MSLAIELIVRKTKDYSIYYVGQQRSVFEAYIASKQQMDKPKHSNGKLQICMRYRQSLASNFEK